MLPGEAPGPWARPAGALQGAEPADCGRGMGRSTGCADENGLLPTRGGRPAGLGDGPGRAPGRHAGLGPPDGRAAAREQVLPAPGPEPAARVPRWAPPGRLGGAVVAGPARLGGRTGRFAVAAGLVDGLVERRVEGLGRPWPQPGPSPARPWRGPAALPPPNDSRSRRATGASTVDDADLTNSPCSFSRARTSLLVTPSSLANSCTRALPATTSPVYEATVVGPRLGFSYDAWSSGLHGVLMFFATCSVAG